MTVDGHMYLIKSKGIHIKPDDTNISHNKNHVDSDSFGQLKLSVVTPYQSLNAGK